MKDFSDHSREQNLDKAIKSDRSRSDCSRRRRRSPTLLASTDDLPAGDRDSACQFFQVHV
ncbi:hypothetical protein B7486_49550 [cyanobacterium TDX16]|nr:hypothetical protein B7486_49550 [cyanobacterium TDX16]